MDIIYQIVPIEKLDLFDKDVDLDLLDQGFNNIYVTGLKTLTKIESVRDLPLKNRKMSIKKILSFIKYVEVLVTVKNNSSDVIEIPQNILIKYFNRNSYVDFLKLLNELNILKAVPYKDGTYYNYGKVKDEKTNKHLSLKGTAKPKRYKLTDEYKNDELCLVIIDDKNLVKIETDAKYEKRLVKTIQETDIDIKSAIRDEIKYSKSRNSLRSRLNVLFNLYEKRYIKKGFKVDRVYHSLTNISKISRKYLNINGKKFNNIDIVNCQPLLLCYYLIKNNLEIDESYVKDCELGTLYERFLIKGKEYIDVEYIIKNGDIVGKKNNIIKIEYKEVGDESYNECRKKIKVLMYKNIYFDFKYDSDICNEFKTIYPKVYQELDNIYKNKKETESKMAGVLQNIESEVFNNIIPKSSKYYFTLFDAIYFTDEDDTGKIMIDILTMFRKYNLVPRLKYNDEISIN